MEARWKLVLLLLLAPFACGCARWNSADLESSSGSPLEPLKPRREQIVVDAVFLRLSPEQAKSLDAIWSAVDEQAIDPAVRHRLSRNGYRAGYLGHDLPADLQALIETAQNPVVDARNLDPAQAHEPGATRHQLYLRDQSRAELVVAPAQAQLHALVWHDGGVEGSTYQDGQPQFSVQAQQRPGGRIELRLIPEIHYGPFQQHYAAGEASMFRLDARRRRQTFAELAMAAGLAPGESLLLGRQTARRGTLGDRFFGGGEQTPIADRLLLLRLVEEPVDALFAPAAPTGD
ncbi:MAG: hypothetical protein DWQ42_06040 [Planctomycetota bacterium]|nr:MAG: hypothetical protein DWQ42_06040 [Planctomycetota bacterium]REK48720.1 MAG: hypothetical protein DWQ46_01880 [Planctomycetota bacterium]